MGYREIARARVLLLLALGAALGCPSAQATMTTPGQFAVSPSGAATYTIPIQVPPGIAGIEPKLALSYNSQAGNGLLGMGWSLSGLSAISRCPQTRAQDGMPGSINYDWNDRFCLDGQRLIAVNGANGTEYRTELDSYARIVPHGSAGNGPAWFQVWTKAGQVMEYGNTADSRIEAQGKPTVRTWALNKLSDTKGNYLTVTYTEEHANGDFYPQRIDYTGNANTGAIPNNSVQFNYEARLDVVPKYSSGSLHRNSQRLLRIQTFTANTLLKDYKLAYAVSSSTLRSRMNSLQECEANNKCLPSHTFEWQEFGAFQYQSPTYWVNEFGPLAGGWSDNNTYPRHVVDVNGDGLADIVGFSSAGVLVALNGGTKFLQPTYWINQFGSSAGWTDENIHPRHVVDINGDGLSDIVGFAQSGVVVSLNDGTKFLQSTYWINQFVVDTGGWRDDIHPRHVVDVNGDGLPDIVGFAQSGVVVSLNDGTKFLQPTSWINQFGSSAGWADNNIHPRHVVDVNGDGLPDIVGFALSGVVVSLNDGTKFLQPTSWVNDFGFDTGGWRDDIHPRHVVDVNGDGLPDIVGFAQSGVVVSLNDGTKFLQPTYWVNEFGSSAGWTANINPRHVVDVNGDGLPDIVGFANAGVFVALNNGTKFLQPTYWVNDFGFDTGGWRDDIHPRHVVDVNGDGLPDIVGFAQSGVVVSVSSDSASKFPDILKIINPSFGKIPITYKPLTDKSIYTKDKGTAASVHPRLDLQFPLYVVSSVSSANGIGGTLTTHYKYGGLKAEVGTGRGMLGFRWIESTQAETGLTVRTEYRQDFPYTGLPSSVQKTLAGSGNGGVLAHSTNSYACLHPDDGNACVVGTGKRYFPYVKSSSEASWDGNGAALPTVTTSSTYDRWGNPTQIDVTTSDGFGKSTVNSYANDETNWLLGRLLKATVSSSAP